MLFNSVDYLILLAVSCFLYWLSRSQTARLLILLVSSLVFYATWEPRFVFLLAGSMLINFGFALSPIARRRFGVVIAIVANLAILAYFKYTNFIVGLAADLGDLLGLDTARSHYSIVLPIGISFYTFQLISYVVDVNRGVLTAERSWLRFGVFMSFFPHLIAGPICRGHQFLPQLGERRVLTYSRFAQGLLMLAIGLLLKIGIADNLAPYANQVYGDGGPSGSPAAWLGTVAFGVQILCDFWGYSTMALGSAHLFGYSVPSNFDLPYIAASLQSFWRRWHITLSFWLRDYLYVPLGGNRKGPIRTYVNLIIVMALGGLWHGASYTFVIWGLIHGIGLAIERMLRRTVSQSKTIAPQTRRLLAPAGWLYTMLVVFVAWVFFRATSLSHAIHILSVGVGFDPGPRFGHPEFQALTFLIAFFILMVPLHLLNESGGNMNLYRHSDSGSDLIAEPTQGPLRISREMIVLPSTGKVVLAFWILVAALIFGSGEIVPFIYFQF